MIFVYTFASMGLKPEITKTETSSKRENLASIDIASNSDKVPSFSTDTGYLKPFDSAVLAYQMMGFGEF